MNRVISNYIYKALIIVLLIGADSQRPRKAEYPSLIFFFGESGVGKTYLIESIYNMDKEKYHIPELITSRARRHDDNDRFITFVTSDEFDKLESQGEMLITLHNKNTKYGYRASSIKQDSINLMYGFVLSMPQYSKIRQKLDPCYTILKILIKGDSALGLTKRNNRPEIRNQRIKMNAIVKKKFYDNPDFVKLMSMIFENQHNNQHQISHLIDRIDDHLEAVKMP